MRIDTAYGLAMTEVDGGWSFFFRCHRHRRAGQCPAPTVCPNRVGATLAVARNAGDGVPYGFPFDPRRPNP